MREPKHALFESSHLTLSRYYYFIFYSSFYPPFFSPPFAPGACQAASGGSRCSTNHFHPLVPLLPHRLFPSASADTSIPVSHSAATRFSLAATPRHVRFPPRTGRRGCSASRKVPVEESPLLLRPAGSVFLHSTIVEVYCRP